MEPKRDAAQGEHKQPQDWNMWGKRSTGPRDTSILGERKKEKQLARDTISKSEQNTPQRAKNGAEKLGRCRSIGVPRSPGPERPDKQKQERHSGWDRPGVAKKEEHPGRQPYNPWYTLECPISF